MFELFILHIADALVVFQMKRRFSPAFRDTFRFARHRTASASPGLCILLFVSPAAPCTQFVFRGGKNMMLSCNCSACKASWPEVAASSSEKGSA
ncbi:MAG: hypothetical protein GY801_06570 [bacterium]|nr:hypothetical protein [bacterium]